MAKDDPRIKIINNIKNMGLLYTRGIGVLFSKGKYIVPLDSDDMLLNSEITDVIYKETEKYKLDIINYKYNLWTQIKKQKYIKKQSIIWRRKNETIY